MNSFKNSGKYAKLITTVATLITGAIPVITTATSWQEVVAYVISAVAASFGVYLVPNSAPTPAAPVAPAPSAVADHNRT